MTASNYSSTIILPLYICLHVQAAAGLWWAESREDAKIKVTWLLARRTDCIGLG
jgi:hypothetical protein